ncbi:MAG: putative 4-mercaptohistidine N1-methyltransferase [Sulfuricurvum sp. 24-42-5]|jgi:putative 4-mercaptohistidine N1-methyltranferase|nr:MAG: putative 4-mercaptohistidine N1-methyltransferase [Sulfuricurvum sp. 24-42-5]
MDTKEINIYETDELVGQYCDFQYGDEYFGVANFAKACAQKAIDYSKGTSQTKALDLGCATGYASFELAKIFDYVDGIDYSQAFVNVAKQLQHTGGISYTQNGEGEIKNRKDVCVDDFGFREVSSKVHFSQGDACALAPEFKEYDLIMATNLIDRLYAPHLFLKTIHERLNKNGVLVLTSPYTWKEEYTAKEFWVGGYADENGQEITTLNALKEMLGKHFELVATEDVPFVIRETPRKFQYTISQMSVWKKK